MKTGSILLLILVAMTNLNCIKKEVKIGGSTSSFPTMDELDAKYKLQWDKPEYANANSATNETYLTDEEKKIYYYLNLARINPQLFASTYASGYAGANGYSNPTGFQDNKASLISDLNKLSALPILLPSKTFYDYANCQALAIGQKGIEGMDAHSRSLTGCGVPLSYGENINFGKLNSLDIVMSWLNDAGNVLGAAQMGHRANCLNPTFDIMGISIASHKVWDKCVVMDLSSK